MSKLSRFFFVLLRISLGWLFFYAGITKVLDPEWTSVGYLESAQTLPEFYTWLASSQIIPWVDFLNQWGLVLIGVSLILGLFVRISSFFGALMMILYLLPVLSFPYIADHSFLVDNHVIYALILFYFSVNSPGRFMGFDRIISKKKG